MSSKTCVHCGGKKKHKPTCVVVVVSAVFSDHPGTVPPASGSKEAVELREAGCAFADPASYKSLADMRPNRRLCQAAYAYAHAVWRENPEVLQNETTEALKSYRWCRARLLAAMGMAHKQGVLLEVLEEMFDQADDNGMSADPSVIPSLIDYLVKNGWVPK